MQKTPITLESQWFRPGCAVPSFHDPTCLTGARETALG